VMVFSLPPNLARTIAPNIAPNFARNTLPLPGITR